MQEFPIADVWSHMRGNKYKYIVLLVLGFIAVGYNNCLNSKGPSSTTNNQSSEFFDLGGTGAGNPLTGKVFSKIRGYGMATTVLADGICKFYTSCKPKYSFPQCISDLESLKTVPTIFASIPNSDLTFKDLMDLEEDDKFIGDLFRTTSAANLQVGHVCSEIEGEMSYETLSPLFYVGAGGRALLYTPEELVARKSDPVFGQWYREGINGRSLSVHVNAGFPQVTSKRPIAVQPGLKYKLSFKATQSEGEVAPSVNIMLLGSSSSTNSSMALISSRNEQTKVSTYEGEITIPPRADAVTRLRFFISFKIGHIVFDDIQLIESNTTSILLSEDFSENPFLRWEIIGLN